MHQNLKLQRLFEGVSLDAVECYFENFTEQTAPAGTVILAKGQKNHSLYLLLEGAVTLHLDDPNHPALYKLGVGECFGEMSLIEQGNTSAYVVAATDCRYLALDQEALWSMVDVSHGVARNLLLILSRRLRNDNVTISANQNQLRCWENFALSDALTGLNNRRWLDDTIDRVVHRTHQDGAPMSLTMLDVDHFKAFNDKWGHPAGDQALRCLAQVIRTQIRPTDLAARYGGEEFVVLLPNTDIEEAHAIAERLRHAIAYTPCGKEGMKDLPPITVSMGVSTLPPGEGDSSLLIANADEALYKAKRAGRNCVIEQL